MRNKHLTILAGIALAALSFLSVPAVRAQPAEISTPPFPVGASAADWAEKKFITNCEWCHGPQGHSISPIYPALAGQKAWYITEQLQAFRARTRGDPYARGMMWGMAAQLDDVQIAALADYLSKQTPFYSVALPLIGSTPAQIAEGKTIYEQGVPSSGVPPCSACHQEAAQGSDQFPRLAGQHASYTLKQLIALHNGTREQVVMNGVAAPLKRPEMKAVAAYLESIR